MNTRNAVRATTTENGEDLCLKTSPPALQPTSSKTT